MEIYLFLLFIGLVEWHMMRSICESMPVPECPTCQSRDTLGHNGCSFYCIHCGDEIHRSRMGLYEHDEDILLTEPDRYDQFKECRNSLIEMGYAENERQESVPIIKT